MCFFFFFSERGGSSVVFFFQAEDGIRDGRVTGVQTCALPIWTVASADFINYVPKLEAAKGTPSVKMVSAGADGTIDFPASVDFGPTHVIVPGATGIRRRRRRLGAVGEDG